METVLLKLLVKNLVLIGNGFQRPDKVLSKSDENLV